MLIFSSFLINHFAEKQKLVLYPPGFLFCFVSGLAWNYNGFTEFDVVLGMGFSRIFDITYRWVI